MRDGKMFQPKNPVPVLVISLILAAAAFSNADDSVGNAACAPCHAEIYQSYSQTPMAQSSGEVGSSVFPADLSGTRFRHPKSGVRYQITREKGRYFLEFEREAGRVGGNALRGRRDLSFFVGSGAAGRSYLFSTEGFLFQAPVSHYTHLGKWDVSPGFERYNHASLNRPIEPNCLECHASQLQWVAGTQNQYRGRPFLQDGIGCERCHGPGKDHVDQVSRGEGNSGRKSMINPAKLDPLRRDSVCEQCHLTGEARISKPGRSLSKFRPGELLTDFVVSFVPASPKSQALRATSHVEKLWQSRCKQVSGDRLWCGTCHNPHSVPSQNQRVAYFQRKCLSCHQPASCTERPKLRTAKGDDCASCHMPKKTVADGGHGVLTDHAIVKFGRRQAADLPSTAGPLAGATLMPFKGSPANDREFALAYAEAALKEENQAWSRMAFEMLRKLEVQIPHDSQILYRLAYLYEQRGESEQAMVLYERARQEDPLLTVATVNLANQLAVRKRLAEALSLWQTALAQNPALEEARINLAIALAQSGRLNEAHAALSTALEYNPDSPAVGRVLDTLKQLK